MYWKPFLSHWENQALLIRTIFGKQEQQYGNEIKHLKVLVTLVLHNSMQYCPYLRMQTATSSGQKKWHEKLRKKCEIGFYDQLSKLGLRTLYTSDKISWKNTCSVVFR